MEQIIKDEGFEILRRLFQGHLDLRSARETPVAASLKKDPQQVINEMFTEAKQRDPEQRRLWSAVVDGDGKQLRHIKQAAKKIQADVTIIIDIVHVSEYLWKAAYCFYDVGSDEQRKNIDKCVNYLLLKKQHM